jgi:hypothetical protein
MREVDIQNQIRKHLEAMGWMVIPNTQPRHIGRCHKGRADLTCIGPRGMFMEVEVKDATGVQSEAQIEYQFQLELRNHNYVLARSVEDASLRVALLKPDRLVHIKEFMCQTF